MNVPTLDQLNLHDSSILSLRVLSEHRIDLRLDYIESYEPLAASERVLRFDRCWLFACEWSMHQAPPIAISSGASTAESDRIESVRSWFASNSKSPPLGLAHHTIDIFHPSPTIEIVCEQVSLLESD